MKTKQLWYFFPSVSVQSLLAIPMEMVSSSEYDNVVVTAD